MLMAKKKKSESWLNGFNNINVGSVMALRIMANQLAIMKMCQWRNLAIFNGPQQKMAMWLEEI